MKRTAIELLIAWAAFTVLSCAAIRSAAKDPASAVTAAKSAAKDADRAVSEACDLYATAVASHVIKPSKTADDTCAADAAAHAP